MGLAFGVGLYSPEVQRNQNLVQSGLPSAVAQLVRGDGNPDENIELLISAGLQHEFSNGHWFSVAEMICTVAREALLVATKDRPVVQALLEATPVTGNCTDVGRAISESLVRNASTRIFSNPHQSIMELISNAIDASLPEGHSGVGKFGFGVFSNFIWLYQTGSPGATVKVVTSTKTETTRLKLKVVEGKSGRTLMAKMSPRAHRHTATTGTVVTVSLGKSSTKDISRPQMLAFVNRFRYFGGHVKIFCDAAGVNMAVAGMVDTAPMVDIRVDEKSFSVRDGGSGMSRDTLFRYFLIPSISSKVSRSSLSAAAPAMVLPSRIDIVFGAAPTGRFSIVVAGVAVVDLLLPCGGELIMHCPPAMAVTIGRDDVLLTPVQTSKVAQAIARRCRSNWPGRTFHAGKRMCN